MKVFILFGLPVLCFASASSCGSEGCGASADDVSLVQLKHSVKLGAVEQKKPTSLINLKSELAEHSRKTRSMPWRMPGMNNIGRSFVGAAPNAGEELCGEDTYTASLMEKEWTANAENYTEGDHCSRMPQADADSWISQNANGNFDHRIFSKLCRKNKAPQFIEPLAGILRDPRFGCYGRNFGELFSVDWLVFPDDKGAARRCANGDAILVGDAEGDLCQCNGLVTYGKKHAAAQAPGDGPIATFDQMKTVQFLEKAVAGQVACNAQTMGGDPVPGHYKHCYCQDGGANKILAPGAKARFYDAGGSHFNDALSFFLSTYQGHGITFDEIYVWEFTPQGKESYWTGVDPAVRLFWEPRVTFYDGVGVTKDKDSEHNPVSRIFKSCAPEDFCSFKLDIDTPSIETPLVQQLLESAKGENAGKLDEFFFEQHVHGAMQPWWGDNVDGTFADSYKLFSELRNLGVRAHSWV